MNSFGPRFSLGHTRGTRRLTAFVLAFVLPAIAADFNTHLRFLEYAPFALYFLSVVVVAVLGGIPPALLTTAFSIFCRSYLYFKVHGLWTLRISDLVGAIVLGLAAFVVSRMTGSRRKATEDLQERTEALIESLHSSKCASWVIDLDSGQSARWFAGSYPIFGRPFSEVEQAPSLIEFLHPDDQPRLAGLIEQMRASSDPIVFEFRAPWPNGDVHWLEARFTRVPNKNAVWRGVTLDVTERKSAEAALLRSEKLAAMGRLASTVAHEINNPLESVTNLLYLARKDATINDVTQSYLAMAEQELARLGNITRLTLGFVRASESPRRIDLAEIADSVLAIFRPRCEMKNIHVQRSFQPDVSVELVAGEVRQVLTNLISNAVDALAASNGCIALHIRRESNTAVLAVEDNGTGIDAAHLSRIFDPFFTTKQDIGTGIGLWVTRELVHKNGGLILAESGNLPDGMKTRFRIEFPIAPPAASASGSRRAVN